MAGKKTFTKHNFSVPTGSAVSLPESPAADEEKTASSRPAPATATSTDQREESTLLVQAESTVSQEMALITDILDSDHQTREGMSEEKFARLVKSMKDVGPLDAIHVRKHPRYPEKWQIVAGGHSRRDAAKAAGLTHYPIKRVDYDDKQSALATARENLAREDLTPLEEGNLYLSMKQFGYTQEATAEELGVSRDRVKECVALAKSAPDIIGMMKRIKQHDAGNEDSNRGLRAAKCLRRLDVFDNRQPGLTQRLREPLINAFIFKQLTTDEIDTATRQLELADDPEKVLFNLLSDLQRKDSFDQEPIPSNNKQEQTAVAPEIQRSTYLTSFSRGFRRYAKFLGGGKPSDDEREALLQAKQTIEEILLR